MRALMTDTVLYRFADPASLAAASASGEFRGEALDEQDGFIHLSTRTQLADTLDAHFAGVDRIALAEIDGAHIADIVKWEVSRGGERFPHAYGAIPFSAIETVYLLRRGEDGAWQWPEAL
ncbi:glutathione S-transferase [Marinicauda pacifica]|jgi:uncharacterized protein (DUF952 family)|nr:glutathione S-transferase [Marinicauda pacifica]